MPNKITKSVFENISTDDLYSSESDAVNDSLLEESTTNEEKNNDPEYLKRNALYSSLLETYIVNYNKKASRKNKYKFAFFIVTMLTFIAIILLSIITIVHMAKKDTTTIYDMSVVFGSVASFITAIVVLPKIIAEHLFPVNEDENMISLVKNMQLNDSEIRKKLK